jgi:hypothetical protein
MVINNPRPRNVVAILGRVRNAPPHLGNAAFIHQVDNQLELVQALEVGDLWLIASLRERLKTRCNQCCNTTTEHRLLTEQVGLGLFGEGRLDATSA